MQLPDNSSAAVGKPVVGNFDQPVLPIADPARYYAVHAAIAQGFLAAKVEGFLQSLASHRVRIRDFASVLDNGLLGREIRLEYNTLGNADQGQIRESYLASLEKVAPELRNQFFKLYAYY